MTDKWVRRRDSRVHSKNTVLSYESALRSYTAWANRGGIEPWPCAPLQLCAYLAWLADKGLSIRTIGIHCAAIVDRHRTIGHPPPVDYLVRETMRGFEATIGTAPRRQRAPLTADLMLRLLTACPDTLIGSRDRAMFAIAFAAALNRSKVVSLQVEDLVEVDDGYRLNISGKEIAVPRGIYLRPVEAVQMWLGRAEISTGPVFRQVGKGGAVSSAPLSDDGYCRAIKRRCEAARLDPALFSGHSMRSGFLASAAKAGADIRKMAEVSGHKSLDALRRYIRRGNLFEGHAGAEFL